MSARVDPRAVHVAPDTGTPVTHKSTAVRPGVGGPTAQAAVEPAVLRISESAKAKLFAGCGMTGLSLAIAIEKAIDVWYASVVPNEPSDDLGLDDIGEPDPAEQTGSVKQERLAEAQKTHPLRVWAKR